MVLMCWSFSLVNSISLAPFNIQLSEETRHTLSVLDGVIKIDFYPILLLGSKGIFCDLYNIANQNLPINKKLLQVLYLHEKLVLNTLSKDCDKKNSQATF